MFLPYGDAFTGGDATYSVVTPNGETVWIFGDTFLGNVTADNKRIKTDPLYIRNSFVTFANGERITHHQGEPVEFKSAIIPPAVLNGEYTELEFWYWPGDAFVDNEKMYVFASKFHQIDPTDMWGFAFRGTDLVELSLPDFKQLSVTSFPDTDSVHYGHAVHEEGNYIYMYGLKKEFPYVARANRHNFRSSWEYFDGTGWVGDANAAVPMLRFAGSEQFSVFKQEDNFVMVMQEGGFGRRIYSFTSNTPFGPWENQQLLYETPLTSDCPECFTYNAVAHPQFIKDEFLLISYNTNSMKLEDHYANAMIYRPRFIRVPMEMILPAK